MIQTSKTVTLSSWERTFILRAIEKIPATARMAAERKLLEKIQKD